MNVFCDSSVLVAAAPEAHPHHTAAKSVLERVARGEDNGQIPAHVLAETFSVLSRMPTTSNLQPQDVLAILERNILQHFTLAVPAPEDYPRAIRALVAAGFSGGRIYDMLHVRLAGKLAPDRIHTFNEREWKAPAPELAPLISAPLPVTAT